MIVPIVLGAIMLAVIAYGIYEVRQWSRNPDLISGKQRRIRTFGFVFLLLSLGLGLNGVVNIHTPPTHHKPVTRATRLAALNWLTYWTLTVITLVPIVPLALLDARENLRRASDQRREILQEALSTVDSAPVDKPAEQ